MEEILKKQREYFLSGATLPYSVRRDTLRKMYEAIKSHEKELQEALKEDLGKSPTESYMCEIGLALSDITYTLRHLKRWMRPEHRCTPLQNFPARSRILKEPYGVALIMSPWNYPLLLSISPIVAAIAAGNVVIAKPSNKTPHVGAFLKSLFESIFDIFEHLI